jgi:hypothetical protein
MRKIKLIDRILITIVLLLIILACNFPSRRYTSTPVCTPPACRDDEVYFCPDECPGGCGTGCATPTVPISKQGPTPGPTPTDTPFPLCTPPACQPDEVYYCEGDCPGGCGTTCVTPSPTVTPQSLDTTEPPTPTSTRKPEVIHPPDINSFIANKHSVLQGEDLNVTWITSGGTSAEIIWLGNSGTMEGIGNLPPDGGTEVINPINLPVILNVSNSAGTTSQNLNITIQCLYAWIPELNSASTGACPKEAESSGAAQQPFEYGFMIWLQNSQSIIVFFSNYGGQSYRIYNDTFIEGDPEIDPNLSPPAGLLQPKRGFGKVWRENDEVRLNLGWATTDEEGFETWQQSYQGMGMHNIRTWIKDINQRILELDPNASAWKIYSP